MQIRCRLGNFIALTGLLGTTPAYSRVYDHLFANHFETPADSPASDAEAARFLTQATFGPTKAEIARLHAIGYGEWLDEQLGMSATLERPNVEAVIDARTAGGQSVGQSQRHDRWFWVAAYAPDQLRQRMAWALSQIFVISDRSSQLSQYVVAMADYYDRLAIDAFGGYRSLLGDVTFHPMMGRYLSHYHNQKPSAATQPDENYAREVMQLFSVGLELRNLDFSLSGGVPIPTYDQTVITHTAKVFTGFTYSDAPTNPPNFYGGAITYAGTYSPMACWGTELFGAADKNMRHDITGDDGTTATPKTVLGGLTIAPNQTCHADVNDELDIIAGHMNVAPFISRQLIQRFVTSNPSPAYIQRAAEVFEDNGAPEHERGDLGAVIRAILTDSEARTAPATAEFGKLREPLLRLTALWRAWDAHAQPADAYGEVPMMAGTSFSLTNFAQRPLSSPTVFNFYLPDYQQPGTYADANLYSPEFQITNESTTYTAANTLYRFSASAYLGMANPKTDRPLLDLSALIANATNPGAMVDEANLRMLYGSMSPAMRTTLINMLANIGSSGGSSAANEKAWSLVYLISISPEYGAQR